MPHKYGKKQANMSQEEYDKAVLAETTLAERLIEARRKKSEMLREMNMEQPESGEQEKFSDYFMRKPKSKMPKHGSMSPKGDLGAMSQAEAYAAGGSKLKGTVNAVNRLKKYSPKVPGGG